jgi:NADP-dependent 3-hydroxy acid dehydrogenase YdfG
MKVAITGHTSGIGQGLCQHFQAQGHEVQGFSRSNGYTLPDTISKVLVKSLSCDIFVNNAIPINSQIVLLEKLWSKWHTQKNKTIVVIGSLSTHVPFVLSELEEYQKQKQELDRLCKQLRYGNGNSPCRLIAIHPGWVDTNICELMDTKKPSKDICMTPQQVAQVVDYAISSPLYIHDVVFNKQVIL